MTWENDAACLNADPDMFFPVKGGSPAPAQKLCARCPVAEQCLELALEIGATEGVWGGVTARNLSKQAGRRARGSAHGTRSRYARGCRCEPCTQAKADYSRRWRAGSVA